MLLTTVERGDLIVVGTIRDLLVTTTSDLLNLLRFLYNKGVEIDSGNEPHCGVIQFIEMFGVFEEMEKIELISSSKLKMQSVGKMADCIFLSATFIKD